MRCDDGIFGDVGYDHRYDRAYWPWRSVFNQLRADDVTPQNPTKSHADSINANCQPQSASKSIERHTWPHIDTCRTEARQSIRTALPALWHASNQLEHTDEWPIPNFGLLMKHGLWCYLLARDAFIERIVTLLGNLLLSVTNAHKHISK